jgi:hypothetical protein
MLLLGRSLRDAEAAVVEWQMRARQADDARQELSQMVASSEAAVKQVGAGSDACGPVMAGMQRA